jgi:hypothetical protein
MKAKSLFKVGLAAALMISGSAFAQAADEDRGTIGEGNKSENLPPPTSDNDPRPPVAAPATPEGGMVRQAGVGGDVAYGRAGVVELGGSASFTTATNLTSLSFSPSIGWFFQDNLELSGILGVQFSNVAGVGSTFVTALVEPSYHIPFSDSVFGFLGIGAGLGYATGAGAGFALAPRLGMNLLVGRSGILTPAAFFNYSTVDISGAGQGATLRVNAAYGLQIGYTVML